MNNIFPRFVHILDTPGLADTRGLNQDDFDKESMETQIKDYIGSINAILVLANGTVPHVTVGTKCALSILSAILPNTVTKNVAFLFTNVSSPIYLNFPKHTLPEFLIAAPHFLLDNPIALQKNYLKMKDGPNRRMRKANLHEVVKAIEQNTTAGSKYSGGK